MGHKINWAKLEVHREQGRLPDNESGYKSPEPYRPRKRWWAKEKKLELPAITMGPSESVDKHVWKNGILDTLFDGPEMEAEIARVAKIMDELE